MLCGSLSFACMAVLASLLRDHCDWRITALARSGLATLFAVALCLHSRPRARLLLFRPGILWVRSIAGSVSLLCTFYAFTRLPVSDLLTLTNTFPIWVAVLSWPLLQEAPDRSVWLSVASGLVGVVLIQQPHFRAGNFATLLALFAAVSSAVAMLGLHRLHHLDPRAIVAHFSGVATLFVLLSFFLLPGDIRFTQPLGTEPLVGVLLLGVGVTATIGQLFLTKAFTAGHPSRVSVVGLSQIVFAMVLERLIRPRDYDVETLAGMGLILAPTAWVLWRGKRPWKEEWRPDFEAVVDAGSLWAGGAPTEPADVAEPGASTPGESAPPGLTLPARSPPQPAEGRWQPNERSTS
jgi:drug/metabolite transporter (DMT)-like permease